MIGFCAIFVYVPNIQIVQKDAKKMRTKARILEVMLNHPNHFGVINSSPTLQGGTFFILNDGDVMIGRAARSGPDLGSIMPLSPDSLKAHFDPHVADEIKGWLRNPSTIPMSPADIILLDGGHGHDAVIFEHNGRAIDDPFRSECGRYAVQPEHYGFAACPMVGGLRKQYQDGSFIALTSTNGAIRPESAQKSVISIHDKGGVCLASHCIPPSIGCCTASPSVEEDELCVMRG